MKKPRYGFNLVEILITLSIVALLTTIVVNAVQDYKDKLRIVRVRNDLMTIGQMCKYVESTRKTLIVTLSETGTELTSQLANYIIKLPKEDPWGRRYWLSEDGEVRTTDSEGFAYIIDRGTGRVISPGPDGICNTQIGHGLSDRERDIVVEFRQPQWLLYNVNQYIYMAKGDGSLDPVQICTGINMQVSPDSTKFVYVNPDNKADIYWGMADLSPNVKLVAANGNAAPIYPFWAPDSRNIVFFWNSNLYSYNTDTGLLFSLTKDNPIVNSATPFLIGGPKDQPRIIYNDGKCSYYHHPEGTQTSPDIFITISSDGKVAYFDKNTGGISMVLIDGTGGKSVYYDRLGVELYRPLLWLDTETIVYTNTNHSMLYRIKQDGTYRMPLYADQAALTAGNYSYCCIAPNHDYSMLAMRRNLGSGNSSCRIVRTNGAGVLAKYLAPNTYQYNFTTGGAPICNSPMVWDKIMNRILFSIDDNTRGFFEWPLVENSGLTEPSDPGVLGSNTCQNVPWIWDLDRSGNLAAFITDDGSQPGVNVFPLSGPVGAITRISDEAPVVGTYPNFSIFWLQ